MLRTIRRAAYSPLPVDRIGQCRGTGHRNSSLADDGSVPTDDASLSADNRRWRLPYGSRPIAASAPRRLTAMCPRRSSTSPWGVPPPEGARQSRRGRADVVGQILMRDRECAVPCVVPQPE
jgi:hypothetical protein